LLITASPASAHAVVVSSTPRDNEHLVRAPTEVTIEFSEPVSIELGGLKVLDSQGGQVDTGSTEQPRPTTLRAALRSGLPEGTYLASYKIVSADGHAISGAIVFTFGNAGATDVTGLIEKTSPSLDAASKVTQFVTYAGALLAVGLAFFATFLHDGGDDRRALARGTTIGAAIGALGIALTVVVQAALVTNGSLTAVFDLSLLRPVLSQGLGWQAGSLLVGLAVVNASAVVKPGALAQSFAFYGGLLATSSFALWGHATDADNTLVTVPADLVHVAAGALWFGGIVGLMVVLRRRHDRGSLASTVTIVRRFSAAAAFSLIALTTAGVTLAFVEVGSLDALTASSYGKLVLLKAGLVAVVVFAAAYNRYFLLPWLFDAGTAGDDDADDDDALDDDVPDDAVDQREDAGDGTADDESADAPGEALAGWQTLRRTVLLEAVLMVAVLGVTAVLVNTTPGRTRVEPAAGPFQQSQAFRTGKVSLTVTPNQPGSNSFHIDLAGPDGRPADLAQKITIEVTMPAKDLGPIQRETIKGGTGHFLVENVPVLSIAGEWEITLIARVSEFDQERITFHDTVG
jgi:copper transport protein